MESMEALKTTSSEEIERLRATIATQQEKFEVAQRLKEKSRGYIFERRSLEASSRDGQDTDLRKEDAEKCMEDERAKMQQHFQEIEMKIKEKDFPSRKSLYEKLVAAQHDGKVLETEVSRLKTELVVEKARAMEDKNAEMQSMQELLIQAEQRQIR